MTAVNHAELLALALLADQPTHGYDLVRRMRAMNVDRWAKVAESTVYAVLARLHEHGSLSGTATVGERRPTRMVYRLTDAGHGRLSELVDQALENPAPMYSDRLVAAVLAESAERRQLLESAVSAAQADLTRVLEASGASGLSAEGRVILGFYADLASAHVRAVRALQSLR